MDLLLGNSHRNHVLYRLCNIIIAHTCRSLPQPCKAVAHSRKLFHYLLLLLGDLYRIYIQLPVRIRNNADLKFIVLIIAVLGCVEYVHYILIAAKRHRELIDLHEIRLMLGRRHHLAELLINRLRQRLRVHGTAENLRNFFHAVFHICQYKSIRFLGYACSGIKKGILHHIRILHGAHQIPLQGHLIIAVAIAETGAQKRHSYQHTAAGRHYGLNKYKL